MQLLKAFRPALLAAHHSDLYQFKLGAAIYRGHNLQAVGWNRHTTHPIMRGPRTLHAEADALLKAAKHTKPLAGGSIYIARLHRDGSPGLARPCERCWQLLVEAGIREAAWTTEEGHERSLL